MAAQPLSNAVNNSGITSVLVVGAGWVGRQIVGQVASHGVDVVWFDVQTTALESGLAWLGAESTAQSVEPYWPSRWKDSISKHVRCVAAMEEVPRNTSLAIETVSEQVSVKRKVLQALSKNLAPDSLIASNSSYFTPSMLDRFVENPSRFAHLHFHVPVWRTQLVDVSGSPRTSEDTLIRLSQFASMIGQHPLIQRVENPGYVFNWLLRALLQAALQLESKQVAKVDEIDFAWKQVTGMELGPFGIMDQIGIDLIHQTMSAARFVDGDEVWQPLIDRLQPYIDAQKLGVKSGAGFYNYQADASQQAPSPAVPQGKDFRAPSKSEE